MGNSFSRRNAVLVQTEGQVGWAPADCWLALPNTSCGRPLLHCYIAAGGGMVTKAKLCPHHACNVHMPSACCSRQVYQSGDVVEGVVCLNLVDPLDLSSIQIQVIT